MDVDVFEAKIAFVVEMLWSHVVGVDFELDRRFVVLIGGVFRRRFVVDEYGVVGGLFAQRWQDDFSLWRWNVDFPQ